MKLLEDRIKRDGEVLDGDVLKINSFLNHQVDPKLMMQVGEEFKRLFADEKIDKILTCEASGIAPGIMTAYQLGVPMVFARKKKPSTLNDAVYWADVFSYTKKVTNKICVEEKFLHNIEELGNTGSVSSALVYAQNAHKFKKNDLITLTVFGGGYSTGACLIKC